MQLPAEIQALIDQLATTEAEARAVADGLSDELSRWATAPGSWSVSQCIDHLAVSNREYIKAMELAAGRGRARGCLRKQLAKPGLFGSWFIRSIEPPVKRRFKAPQAICPRTAPPLADSLDSLVASHDRVREFLVSNADLDLASIHFPNPFIPGVRFSLATGIHVIPAHERRHLWQARMVRQLAENAQD
jgi:hypothetical protein